MRDFAPLSAQSDSATFWGFLRKATAEARAPILTQNISNDAVPHKEVPLGGGSRNQYLRLGPPFFSKTAILRPISTGQLFRLKTALTLDGSRVNDS